MVMDKNKKVILIITIFVLFFGGIAIGAGAVYWMTRPEIVESGREDGLTEMQFQFLTTSVLSVEHMNYVRRRNTWLILDAMREVDFVENRQPGQSGAGTAAWILELLGVGEIQELEIVDIFQMNPNDLSTLLTIRVVGEYGDVFYALYCETWGMGIVIADHIDGEWVYDSHTHSIIDGQICDRWTDECRCFTDACR